MFNWGAFFTYTLLTAFTPGPNNIVALSNSSRYGFRKSLRLLWGMCAGFLVVMVLCGIFSVMLFSFIPKIRPVMNFVGAAYILWLAWHVFRSRPQADAESKRDANRFLTGFALQFMNVKIMLYGITSFSNFILPHYASLLIQAMFALLITVIGCSGMFTWTLFGSAFQKVFTKYGTALNTVMALLLVYCAVSIFLD